MEVFTDKFKIIKRDMWIARVDFKDAFFAFPVHIPKIISKILQILGYAKWLLRCNADFYKNLKACFWKIMESSSYLCYIC